MLKSHTEPFLRERKATRSRRSCWVAVKIMYVDSMRRLHERILGTCKNCTGDIWLLGKCYNSSSDSTDCQPGYSAFLEDYSSRIWITYRKGFDAIGDSKYTSDVNWGCMIRTSQMLVAQALCFHHLGRSWRKPLKKPYDQKYIEILHLFGDSKSCKFSIHNLLEAGSIYELAAGSWVGPYAMCRTWETIVRTNREQANLGINKESLPMALYIVSGDEEGERGGAPVVCIDVAAKLCSDFSKGQLSSTPILLLVPLVLGLDKINPRYIPLLRETLLFPQSLGILGGKPGVSSYIIGAQDDKALYLDPHEVQQAVDIKRNDVAADTSSYHCSTVRHLSLDLIDPSVAIGFYCQGKEDFEDFCSRAMQLASKSNGAPLFTVVQSLQPTKSFPVNDGFAGSLDDTGNNGLVSNILGNASENGGHDGDDEWQIL